MMSSDEVTGSEQVGPTIEMLIAAINEQLQATDGGGVELIDFDGEMLTVRLHGACVGCPMSQYTLAMGIGQTVKQFFPGLKQIQAV